MAESLETVLRYHNRDVNLSDWTIEIKDLSKRKLKKAQGNVWGTCNRSSKTIKLHEGIPTIDQLGTVILHEVVHAGFSWADQTDEKCTSTSQKAQANSSYPCSNDALIIPSRM